MNQILRYAKSVMTALAITATYAATAAPAATVTPEDGATVSSIESITVEYSDVTVDQLEIVDKSAIMLTNNDTYEQIEVEVVKQLRRAAFTIKPTSAITAPGTYGLFIPGGAFKIAGEDNGEIDNVYFISEGQETPDVPDTPESIDPMKVISITPAPGEVESLSEWNFSFSCEFGLENRTAKFSISGPEGVAIPELKNRATGTGASIFFDEDAVITAPGKYVLTIPAGRYILGEEGSQVLNPEYTFEYIVKGGATIETPYAGTITSTPEEGSVEKIESIILTFEGDVAIEDASLIYLADVSTASTGSGEIAKTVKSEGNKLIITPDKTITKVAQYLLTIGKNAITIGGQSNPEYSLTYVVAKSLEPWAGTVTANPSDESKLESINVIEIKFDGATSLTLNAEAKPADFPALYKGDGTKVAQGRGRVSGNTLKVTFTEVTSVGTYALIVPVDYIYIDGAPMEDQLVLTYYIDAPATDREITCTVDPEPNSLISGTQRFIVSFEAEGLKSISRNTNAFGKSMPYFTSADGAKVPSVQLANLTEKSFAVNHQYPFSVDGDYTLVIPAGYITFTFDDGYTQKNQEFTFAYTVKTTSIDSVVSDADAKGDAYNLLGVRVLRNGTLEQVKSLPVGIYIFNGKKIVVK